MKTQTIRNFVWVVYTPAVVILSLWLLVGRTANGLADKLFDFAVNGKTKVA